MFHELGHNLGNMHSSTYSDEYGDCTCAMAACYGYRCYNAPQMWRLGWNKPLAVLSTADQLPIGGCLSVGMAGPYSAGVWFGMGVAVWLGGCLG